MEGGKRCFSSRCAGSPHDKTIINQSMLRFRPIAPKPATGGSVSGGSPPENKNVYLTNTRAKRKYVRVAKKNRCNTYKKTTNEEREDNLAKTTVTLQLLPENSNSGKESLARGSWRNIDLTVPIWLNIKNSTISSDVTAYSGSDRMAAMPPQPTRVVESWVTVECVTETYMEGGGMGSRDAEGIRNILEADTCPGFVSDDLNRVQWVNQAYKRMMMMGQQNDGKSLPAVVVRLVVKEELPIQYPAFACRVRVQSMWQQEQKHSQIMPCDAWMINGLGLAWRLDVKAALSLGR